MRIKLVLIKVCDKGHSVRLTPAGGLTDTPNGRKKSPKMDTIIAGDSGDTIHTSIVWIILLPKSSGVTSVE